MLVKIVRDGRRAARALRPAAEHTVHAQDCLAEDEAQDQQPHEVVAQERHVHAV